MEKSVSGGNAVTHGTSLGEIRAAASAGTIGQPDENGNVLEWSYDDNTQTLTITGIGKLDGFNGNSLKTDFFENIEIKKVQFQNCKVIGSMARAFASIFPEDNNISKVEQIDFSDLDTSNVTNMSFIFYGCSNLKNLDLSNFDTSSVTDMWSMFYGCSNLENLDLSNFDTSSVTDMWSMFYGCSSLCSLDVSGFDTSNVGGMESMFEGCSNLDDLDLSNFDTSSVTNLAYMFEGCHNLRRLNLAGFDTSNVSYVTGMLEMFRGCSSLSEAVKNLVSMDEKSLLI